MDVYSYMTLIRIKLNFVVFFDRYSDIPWELMRDPKLFITHGLAKAHIMPGALIETTNLSLKKQMAEQKRHEKAKKKKRILRK